MMAAPGLISVKALLVSLVLLWPLTSSGGQGEGNVSMSLIKIAEMQVEKTTRSGKIKAQAHVVKKGEHLWQILRKKGILDRPDRVALCELTKELNKGIPNLDMLRPGDRLLIPVVDASESYGGKTPGVEKQKAEKGAGDAGNNDPDNREQSIRKNPQEKIEVLKVKKGDSLLGLIAARMSMKQSRLYNEYLPRIKALNPHIKDINRLTPGQLLRIPVLGGLKEDAAGEAAQASVRDQDQTGSPSAGELNDKIADSLGRLFSALGEEWINKGKHFIPLKSAGQVDLDGELFPLLACSTGMMVVVDLHNRLPPRIAGLIEASWGNYRVVHLGRIDFATSVARIIKACGYEKVYGKGEHFKVPGDLEMSIAADWIVTCPDDTRQDGMHAIVIRLLDGALSRMPAGLVEYLRAAGVKVIDFPGGGEKAPEQAQAEGSLKVITGEPEVIVGEVLSVVGKRFRERAAIPVSRGKKGEFSFTVTADYLVNVRSREAIIDISGLGPDLIAFLKEKGYGFLSLSGETSGFGLLKKLLEFLGISFREAPQNLFLLPGDGVRNVRVTLNGVAFSDYRGRSVLVTSTDVPYGIAVLLEKKGLRMVQISSPQ
ncbi:MAG: LysM peptidoglycan-binding domain-containing protein [Desulfobacteraceae bacterium]|nr:MAG: LysM peptidoglycan-binding domain-containing protein [Desulfobacteraceae bacterium]